MKKICQLLFISLIVLANEKVIGAGCTPGTNNNCANAITLTIDAACTNGTTCSATTEGGETLPCGATGTQTVWYKFVANSTDLGVTIDNTLTGGCHLASGVWSTGSCLPATTIACKDAVAPTDITYVLSGLTVSNTYLISLVYGSGGPCGSEQTFCVSVFSCGNSKLWKTTGTNAWGTASNWNPSGVPGPCDDVTIPSGGTQPTISATAECRNLTINSGATLTVSGGGLDIYGNMIVNGTFNTGAFFLDLFGINHTWGGTGSFSATSPIRIQNGANYTLTANQTVSHLNHNGTSATPITNGVLNLGGFTLTVTSAWGGVFYLNANTGILKLQGSGSIDPAKTNWGTGTLWVSWNITTNSNFNLDDDYYNVWLQNTGDPTKSLKVGNDAQDWDIRNDVWIYDANTQVTNSGTIKIGSGANGPASTIGGDWINDGIFVQGSSTVSFVGIAEQEIKGVTSTTFYNLTINNTSSTGVVVVKECTVNTTLTLTDGILNTDQNSKYIYLPSTASVSPVGGSANSYVDGFIYKNGTSAIVFPTGDGTKWARIAISAPSVATQYGAKYFYTGFGTYTLAAGPPTLTDVSDSEYWMLNQMIGSSDVQVTLYWEDASGSGINDCDGTPDDLRVAHWNGSAWEINIDGVNYSGTCGTAGSIQTNAAQPTYSPFTFGSKSLVVNPLPVTLVSFDATYNGTDVDITWVTASETNNDFFTVERSQDGTDFTTIAIVDGAGNSRETRNYETVDHEPYTGVSYYRLKQTDFDGKFTYSEAVAVMVARTYDFSVRPNPAKNVLNVSLSCSCEIEVDVEFTNIIGKPVKHVKYFLKQGAHTLPVDIRELRQGIYFIKVSSGDDVYMEKFVKE